MLLAFMLPGLGLVAGASPTVRALLVNLSNQMIEEFFNDLLLWTVIYAALKVLALVQPHVSGELSVVLSWVDLFLQCM